MINLQFRGRVWTNIAEFLKSAGSTGKTGKYFKSPVIFLVQSARVTGKKNRSFRNFYFLAFGFLVHLSNRQNV